MNRFIIFLLLLAIIYAIHMYYEHKEKANDKNTIAKDIVQKKQEPPKIEEIGEDEVSLGSLEELKESDFNELGSLIETNDIGSNDSLFDEA